MQRAGGGEVDQHEAGAGEQFAAEGRGLGTVEGDGAEPGEGGGQRREVVGVRIADGGVAAAGAGGGGDHVPERDAGVDQRGEAGFVRERGEVAADDGREQVPELVLRMGVIATLGQAELAGQAAADEQAGVGAGDRREGRLAGQAARAMAVTTRARSGSARSKQTSAELSMITSAFS